MDANEIKAIFKGQCKDQKISDKMWVDLIKEADIDGDG